MNARGQSGENKSNDYRNGSLRRLLRGALTTMALVLGATTTAAQLLDVSYGVNGVAAVPAGNTSFNVQAVALQYDGKLVCLCSDSSGVILVRLLPSGLADPVFGIGGVATAPGGGGAGGLSIDASGKITVVAGNFSQARFNPDGTLDPTFGIGGIVGPPPSNLGLWICRAAITQPDGKLVAAGWGGFSSFNNPYAEVVRYEIDGSLDTTFNGGVWYGGYGSGAWSLTQQPDGRIVVVGAVGGAVAGSTAVWRINSNGILDCTFNDPPECPCPPGIPVCNGGIATQYFHGSGSGFSHADSVAVLANGSMILKGYADSLGFAAVKFDGDGHVDTSFGTGGTITGVGSPGFAFWPDAGGRMLVNGSGSLGLKRLNPDGSWDNTFGLNGNISAPFGGAAACTLVDTRGRILAAGHQIVGSSGELVVARFSPVRFRRR